jgi:hypothetical protein
VTVPAHLKEVLEGLRDAATRGSAPAAREYRALLAAYPTSRDIETLEVKQPEDMTPEEREQLRAWLLREYAKAKAEEEGGAQGASLNQAEEGNPRRLVPAGMFCGGTVRPGGYAETTGVGALRLVMPGSRAAPPPHLFTTRQRGSS